MFKSPITLGLLAAALVSTASAQVVPTNAFVRIGTTTDATASGFSTSGGTITYNGSAAAGNDAGLRAQLSSNYTFDSDGDQIIYSFRIQNINTAGAAGSANAFRSGFDFGPAGSSTLPASGTINFTLGYAGTNQDGRFSFNTGSHNEFSGGTAVQAQLFNFGTQTYGAASASVSSMSNTTARITTGNTVDVTLRLTRVSSTGSTYTYSLIADVENGAGTFLSRTKAATNITIAGNVLQGVYNLTNTGPGVEVAGNTWRIANAVVIAPEPSAFGGVAALFAFILARRRA